MKKIKFLLGALCVVALSITGCQTDTVNETPEEQAEFDNAKRTSVENVTSVKHNYNYEGDRFSVTYVVNNDTGALLRSSGDVDRVAEYVAAGKEPEGILFTNLTEVDKASSIQAAPSSVEFEVMLFSSNAAMESYVVRAAGSPLPPTGGTAVASRDGAEGPCYSFTASGVGDFYFYKHDYYDTEMTSLRRLDDRFFQNHYVGNTHNDEMTSLIVLKPFNRSTYTVLKKHSCFNGKSLAFYQGPGAFGFGAPNLSWFGLGWFGNWNDEVSSVYGYAW
jgi:hypothetical protein